MTRHVGTPAGAASQVHLGDLGEKLGREAGAPVLSARGVRVDGSPGSGGSGVPERGEARKITGKVPHLGRGDRPRRSDPARIGLVEVEARHPPIDRPDPHRAVEVVSLDEQPTVAHAVVPSGTDRGLASSDVDMFDTPELPLPVDADTNLNARQHFVGWVELCWPQPRTWYAGSRPSPNLAKLSF